MNNDAGHPERRVRSADLCVIPSEERSDESRDPYKRRTFSRRRIVPSASTSPTRWTSSSAWLRASSDGRWITSNMWTWAGESSRFSLYAFRSLRLAELQVRTLGRLSKDRHADLARAKRLLTADASTIAAYGLSLRQSFSRTDAAGEHRARLHLHRRRLVPHRAGQHARHLHRNHRGHGAAIPAQQRQRLGHQRIRHAAALHPDAHARARSPRAAPAGARTKSSGSSAARCAPSPTWRSWASAPLFLDCDVIQADGGTRTASITGAFVAMGLAMLRMIESGALTVAPIRDYIAATSVGIVDGEIMLDLSYEEDSRADVDMNLVDHRQQEVGGGAGHRRAPSLRRRATGEDDGGGPQGHRVADRAAAGRADGIAAAAVKLRRVQQAVQVV